MHLTFAIMSYTYDSEKVEPTIAKLKQNYPEADVIHIPDLPPNRVKPLKFAGLWTQRYLAAALETSADIIIRIDPDTLIYRKLTTFPTADIFGGISQGTRWHVMGGAIGFQRNAAERIVASKILLEEKYTSLYYGNLEIRHGLKPEFMAIQDLIMADVIERLSLTVERWTEVYMYNETYGLPQVDDTKYGFVHK